ncbi:LysR family transcriptional regulator [Paracoccus aestuariivivens]|uniref:LysR family transcriptional regulator n=1 Tax=Paracoccus aestuariivivens TaxID=1820333 RepID=A0A6L6JD03_9RHOB|nr:LysR family transcriptional regulator [Paracoccus aestuariivivens]MTH79992.1 LysR family transcriptional regulator [Paracoccus aestuariivivens]
MRYKKLDMNLLAALDVLLRTRSVSMAADEMFITQSAMSNALGRLRQYFSDPLLVQVGRQMELSPLALNLQEPLRDIIMQVDGSIISSPSFKPATSEREFSIVLSDYSLAVLGERLTRRIVAEAPGIRVNFRPQMASPAKLLERGEVDLLIIPDSIAMDSHSSEPLFDDRLVVLASTEYEGPDHLDRERFCKARMVVMEPCFGQESYAIIAMRNAGLEPRSAISTFGFTSIADLVHGPDHLALLQERLAFRAAASGRFRLLEPPVAFPPLRQTVRWHRHRSRDPGLIWLRGLLRDCVAN